jgi:hypothetical protein
MLCNLFSLIYVYFLFMSTFIQLKFMKHEMLLYVFKVTLKQADKLHFLVVVKVTFSFCMHALLFKYVYNTFHKMK